ncbi:PilZ domain-containing protein [Sphingopyxis sp.]|uniref:PilZ domain-containing protein n=1 Tax=Sphingopyxis sp. TaxID=1908224 RepID=UPI0025FD75A9|nr:PilZ domain-containing protein [Sphingopyxis sp.]
MESSSNPRATSTQRITDIEDMTLSDRRSAERYRTICRIARVQRADDMGLWLVRNISNEGLMLAADAPVTVGETLDIALSETTLLRGTIVWAERGRCGIAFDAPIDAAALLRGLADEQRAEGYRALRLPVEVEAIIALRDDARPIDLVDISQHGAGFRYDRVLDAGTEVDLILPGSDLRRRALVRWSRGQRGGLWFTQKLDRAALESIALLRR